MDEGQVVGATMLAKGGRCDGCGIIAGYPYRYTGPKNENNLCFTCAGLWGGSNMDVRFYPNAEGERRAASARTLHPLVGDSES